MRFLFLIHQIKQQSYLPINNVMQLLFEKQIVVESINILIFCFPFEYMYVFLIDFLNPT